MPILMVEEKVVMSKGVTESFESKCFGKIERGRINPDHYPQWKTRLDQTKRILRKYTSSRGNERECKKKNLIGAK